MQSVKHKCSVSSSFKTKHVDFWSISEYQSCDFSDLYLPHFYLLPLERKWVVREECSLMWWLKPSLWWCSWWIVSGEKCLCWTSPSIPLTGFEKWCLRHSETVSIWTHTAKNIDFRYSVDLSVLLVFTWDNMQNYVDRKRNFLHKCFFNHANSL